MRHLKNNSIQNRRSDADFAYINFLAIFWPLFFCEIQGHKSLTLNENLQENPSKQKFCSLHFEWVFSSTHYLVTFKHLENDVIGMTHSPQKFKCNSLTAFSDMSKKMFKPFERSNLFEVKL